MAGSFIQGVGGRVISIHFIHLTRGHKVPALISKIRIFKTNTATATKFGDFI